MKAFEDILPLVFGIIIAIVLFFGLVTALKKSFRISADDPNKKIDSRMRLKEQRWHMDDIRRRQKQLLRDQKQKVRDLQRR